MTPIAAATLLALATLAGCTGDETIAPGPTDAELRAGGPPHEPTDAGARDSAAPSPCGTTPCDDGNPCTADKCDAASGRCVFPVAAAPCDDGNPCTLNDRCESGTCSPGDPKNCDDANPCTADACDLHTGGCVRHELPGSCDDANPCTEHDACKGELCIGAGKDCDDANPCTGDSCTPAEGCRHPALHGPCDDGDACTAGDHCVLGACEGTPLAAKEHCDDGNPCTDDACKPAKGCVHTFNGAGCEDGNPCTEGDKCALGTCHKGAKAPGCACAADEECQAFDHDLCDGTLLCNLATRRCELDPATVVVCKKGPCFVETCIATTGACLHKQKPTGTPCDADGDRCTVGDRCEAGTCTIGKPALCDDGNPCTDDACKPLAGCVHLANSASCTDANPCTLADACAGRACQPGAPKSCDDGRPCTADRCRSGAGCVHDVAALDGDPCDADGSVCTVGDACKLGVCVKGKALQCDDGNACTSDSCDPAKACVYTANASACDDANPCTLLDACKAGVCQSGALKACVDGDKCTKDVCDSASGACVHAPVPGCSTKCAKDGDCDDANPCTDDTCDGGSCANRVRTGSCDDGNACTTGDACKAGRCRGATIGCADGNDCTADDCNPEAAGGRSAKGCVNSAKPGPCDADGNLCTVGDACKSGKCVAGQGHKCDDGRVCTTDACDPSSGLCSFQAGPLNGRPCDADGSLCTHGDRCQGGTCKVGPGLSCDDANPCTGDACAPATGCTHAALASPCEDGDKCTVHGRCVAGKCLSEPRDCDDGRVCTGDACDAETGKCVHPPILGCATDCKNKAECDDADPCTDDACVLGTCRHTGRTGACADADKCYLAGTCQGGVCAGAQKVKCDDANPCTDDHCAGAAGTCVFEGNHAPCEDGSACTIGDRCAFAKCVPGKPVQCNDHDPCTDDRCDPKTGKCGYTHNQAPCDDGNACTIGDRCTDGVCGPGELGVPKATIGAGLLAPAALWLSSSGTVIVADPLAHRLRAIEVDDSTQTFAGDGQVGFVNGPRLNARFSSPRGLADDLAGNLYVADAGNHVLRIISAAGVVGHFVGDGGPGSQDGYGVKARLHTPVALASDAAALYLTDIGTHEVKIVTLDGLVSTLAGGGVAGFKDDVGTIASFDTPMGVAPRPDGSVWVADAGNHRIRRISVTGVVTTVAGDGIAGQVDGPASKARFFSPGGLWPTPGGDLLVADTGNRRIRVIDAKGMVHPVLGDGYKSTLWKPLAVVMDGRGRAWVADTGNHRVRRFDMPVRECDDGNTCTIDACLTATGECRFYPRANGESCGQGCLKNQICKGGACRFGLPRSCDDFDACTNDYCAAGVCKNVPIAGCK